MIARCECYKLTRQIAFIRGVAHGGDPDRPIAHSAGTFMLKPLGELARFLPLLGPAKHVVGRLDLLEALGRFLVALA